MEKKRKVKEIKAGDIIRTIAQLFEEACYYLPKDVFIAIEKAKAEEESTIARNVLDKILQNAKIASNREIPLCQDTGVAVVFLELGQEVHITGGGLYAAINEGVRLGYDRGYLNNLIVCRPTSDRIKAKYNTPAMIHTEIVPGDKLKIIALPKGGGSENMSRLTVLSPAQGRQGIIDYVVNLVSDSGANFCPPIIVGVGIGGTTEVTMMLAKKALLRKVGEPSPNTEFVEEVSELEKEILQRINDLGIGAMGYGGKITALAIHIETYPCEAGSLPVAVNFQCHSARRKEAIL